MKKREIFALSGVKPENLAYGMAKYSRSNLSIRESLAQVTADKTRNFLNTFYFQYGHRSIADMAHLPMAFENVSMLAAIEIEDEQRWDGQERSTRYQDFSQADYYVPDMLTSSASLYHEYMEGLFSIYRSMHASVLQHYRDKHPRPADMDEAKYERTLNARAFDVARYFLPLATLTSVGQITNARTLSDQVRRLRSSIYPEVQVIGDGIVSAAEDGSRNCGDDKEAQLRTLLNLNRLSDGASPAAVREALKSEVLELERYYKVEHSPYDKYVGVSTLQQNNYTVSYETYVVTNLLYSYTSLSYVHLHDLVSRQDRGWLRNVISIALDGIGRDELTREFRAASGIVVDFCSDIGSFRDFHRHRRTQQYRKANYRISSCDFTLSQSPGRTGLNLTGILSETFYNHIKAIDLQLSNFLSHLKERGDDLTVCDYMVPLGWDVRYVMQMDLAEMAYIAKLRSQPSGHYLYRELACKLYEGLSELAPDLASALRLRVSYNNSEEFFKR